MVSDSELIRQCKSGSQKYQAMMYEKYAPVLMGICMRYARNAEDAEDLFHDAFVKILTNIDSCDENGNLSGWVKKITVNTCINAYYKKKREAGNTIEAEDVAETAGDFRIQQNDFITQTLLLKFINELPDGYRTVFNLFEIDGYSHLEISEMTGSSYSTVRSQLFKAKRTLKQKIEKYLGEELKDHVNHKE